MPPEPDNPEPNSTLPHPELNPLVNPVLGANMGRWAEVYFTSPPEKREEAVLELLRELQGEPTAENEPSVARPKQIIEPLIEHGVERAALAEPQTLSELGQTCPSCGHSTRGQRFCGMCGIEVQAAAAAAASRIFDPESEAVAGEHFEESDDRRRSPDLVEFSGIDPNPGGMEWRADDGPRFIPNHQPTPAPARYRIYLGVAITILVGASVYMVWRGTHAGIESPRWLPPPTPAATTESPAQPQTPALSKAVTPDVAKTANSHPSDAAAPGTSASPAPIAASAPAGATAEPAPATQQKGNGSEELAVAESYLNGSEGKARDSAEAAKWLWRSVSKQNPTAALMLSDLYLRGNGVPQSCDQARLLLDAAAQKGAAGATERLRNLAAFGCQ